MSKFFSGLVTGVVLGIMFAPDKGSETRRRIARTSGDVKHTFTDMIDGAKDGYETIKNKVNSLSKKEDDPAYSRNADNSWPPA
ncbi:MAG: YtxH domain-containing protein [Chitinophagaceae bacterium]|jgi:gas vesicle protein|nr:YtxH domain-containing protein [Chitinophagaceae bacterium]